MTVDYSLSKKLYRTSRNVIIAGLVSEGEQGLTIQDDQPSPSLTIVYGLEQARTPTIVLAQQAATQLTEKNIKVILSRYYYCLPMADADRNAQLTHWHDAISVWYGQNVATAHRPANSGVIE